MTARSRALVLLGFACVELSWTARPVGGQVCSSPYCNWDHGLFLTQFVSGGPEKLRWNFCTEIKVYIDALPTGFPADAVQEIGAAYNTWNALSNWYKFSEATSVTEAKGTVHFIETDWPGQEGKFGRTGVTRSTDDKRVLKFITQFNLEDHPPADWSSTCEDGKVHIRTAALHEAGHALGLTHLDSYDGTGSDVAGCSTVMKWWGGHCPCRIETGTLDAQAIQIAYDDQAFALSLAPCEYNPVAFVESFRYAGGAARWSVLHEWKTKEYVIEGYSSGDAIGVPLAVEPAGMFEYSVAVSAGGFKWLRLVEIEESGRRRELAVCPATEPRPSGAAWRTVDTISPRREEIAREVALLGDAQSAVVAAVENPTCVVYTMPAHAAVLQSGFADYWNVRGQAVQIVEMPLLPDDDSARNWVRDSIRGYASAKGVKLFHLVSDWADDFTSPLWSYSPYWQSKFNAYVTQSWFPAAPPNNSLKIPPFLLPDVEREAENTARHYPYVYSDRPYADLDDEGIPDVVVTRWPFSNATDVAVACENMRKHRDAVIPLNAIPRHVTFLGNDQARDVAPQSQVVFEAVEALRVYVEQSAFMEYWAGADVSAIYRSQFDSYSDTNPALRDHLNAEMPDLITILAQASNVHAPGGFFLRDAQPLYPSWDMNELTAGWYASAVLAASCQTTSWVPFSVGQAYHVYRDFLITPDRGTTAWIGPTTGSYQNENFLAAQTTLEELCASPYRSTAESWTTAMQRAYLETGDPLTLDAYAFLGNPLSAFQRTPVNTMEAFVRKPSNPLALYPNDETVAIGCPQGDIDKLVIKIKVEYSPVGSGLTAGEVVVSGSPNPGAAVFPEHSHADATPELTWLGTKQAYEAVVTIPAFSGCGEYSLPVTVRGVPLGHVRVRIKSPDLVLNSEITRGAVTIADFAEFGSHSSSSVCDCVYTNPYSSCADYVPPDTSVTNADFSFWGLHYGHTHAGGGSSLVAMTPASEGGSLRLEVEEEQPLIGQHKIRARVILEDMHYLTTAVIALQNENDLLRFLGWTPAPTFEGLALCSDLVRDGTRQMFIGVLADHPVSGEITIGTAEFAVDSEEPVQLTESDFELITGEILVSPSSVSSDAEPRRLSALDRRMTVTPRSYWNELAQNYPNPFNPTTTIAFSLAKTADAGLRYDVRGAAVRTLANGRRDAGVHRIQWDGRNNRGQPVASGVYVYKLVAGSFTDTKKMTILK